MSNSRYALLGLVGLLVSACTVVLQPAPPVTEPEADVSVANPEPTVRPPVQQPRRRPTNPDPPSGHVEPEADAGVADPEPTLRPPVQQPRRRPANPDPPPGHVEPESPSPRPTPRTAGINLGIPPGHLPRAGECRVWVQGRPPGLQPRARTCHGILATAPLGSWILYRPAQYQRQIRVRYLHTAQQTIVAVRAFDAETGAYLRDFALAEDDDNMDPRATGVNRPTVGPTGRPIDNRGNGGSPPGRTGNARDRDKTTSNNGVAVGRADSTRSRGPTIRPVGRPANNPGNSGNPPGRSGSARARDTTASNIGVAVGRADTTRSTRPTGRPATDRGNSGNTGTADRSSNGTDKSTNPSRETTAAVADTTSTGRVAGDNKAIRPRPADNVADPIARGRDRQNGQTDSPLGPSLGIDARHFPQLGKCRVWVPGLPFGRQARPTTCNRIANEAPAGAWILRRPAAQPDVLIVDYVHEETPGLVVRTNSFDAATGAALHSARLEP